MERWDAIIVGAGPAGCAAAYDLAAAGRAVLLLDRAEFPRHKACAGGLTRKSPARAAVFRCAGGAGDGVGHCGGETQRRSGDAGQPERGLRDDGAPGTGRLLSAADTWLGAKFGRIGAIAGIEVSDDGVVVRTAKRSYQGRFLIGADGVHSRVRQLVYGDNPRGSGEDLRWKPRSTRRTAGART